MRWQRAGACCLLVAALAACGGSGGEPEAAAPTSAPPAAPSTTPSSVPSLPEPVEIVFEPTAPGIDLETLKAQLQVHLSEVYFGTRVELRDGRLVVRTREDVEEVTEEIVGDLEIRGILAGPPEPEAVMDPCLPGPAGTDLVEEDGCLYLTGVVVPTTSLLDVTEIGTDQVKVTLDDAGRLALQNHLQSPMASPQPRIAFVSDERVVLTVDVGRGAVTSNELSVVYESTEGFDVDFNRFLLDDGLRLGFAPLRRVS